jgi:hypothetical protein
MAIQHYWSEFRGQQIIQAMQQVMDFMCFTGTVLMLKEGTE